MYDRKQQQNKHNYVQKSRKSDRSLKEIQYADRKC